MKGARGGWRVKVECNLIPRRPSPITHHPSPITFREVRRVCIHAHPHLDRRRHAFRLGEDDGRPGAAVGPGASRAEGQGFKVGPDFIDPGHHARITGRPGRNLDTWMLDDDALAATFRRGAAGADVAIVEGVMGLFDGRGPLDEAGSTADLARRWGLPVVLVVDARGMARSVGPMVRGFATFDPTVQVAAVAANRVGSHRHYADYLRPALRATVPSSRRPATSRGPRRWRSPRGTSAWSRPTSRPPARPRSTRWRRPPRPRSRSTGCSTWPGPPRSPGPRPRGSWKPIRTRAGATAPGRRVRVAVARDPAFCFYYEDNLDLLRAEGAELAFFSPLDDPGLPEGSELVYLGGGYPEVFAGRLAANASFRARNPAASQRRRGDRRRVRRADGLRRGPPRCLGGEHRMWGLIPARVVMQPRFAALGYVTVAVDRPSPRSAGDARPRARVPLLDARTARPARPRDPPAPPRSPAEARRHRRRPPPRRLRPSALRIEPRRGQPPPPSLNPRVEIRDLTSTPASIASTFSEFFSNFFATPGAAPHSPNDSHPRSDLDGLFPPPQFLNESGLQALEHCSGNRVDPSGRPTRLAPPILLPS